jgi:hypothetical protein
VDILCKPPYFDHTRASVSGKSAETGFILGGIELPAVESRAHLISHRRPDSVNSVMPTQSPLNETLHRAHGYFKALGKLCLDDDVDGSVEAHVACPRSPSLVIAQHLVETVKFGRLKPV